MFLLLFFGQIQLIFSKIRKADDAENHGYDYTLCQAFDSLAQTYDESFYGYLTSIFKVELRNDVTIDSSCFLSLQKRTTSENRELDSSSNLKKSIHFVNNRSSNDQKSKITLTLRFHENAPYSYFVIGENIELKIEGKKVDLQYLDVSRALAPSAIQSVELLNVHTLISSFSYLNTFKSVEFIHLTLSGKMEKVTCLLKQVDKDRGSLSLYATLEENSFLTLNEDSLQISSEKVSKPLASHESQNCTQIAQVFKPSKTVKTEGIKRKTVEDGVTTGPCGDNVEFSHYSQNATLIIFGTGAMTDFGIWDALPWSGYNIVTIIVLSGVTTIGDYAFKNCNNLYNVKIEEGVERIGQCAFSRCKQLTDVTIPESVSSIGDSAFDNCELLKSVSILGDVTIGLRAFSGDERLETVNLMGNTVVFGSNVFSSCPLRSVYFGSNLVVQEFPEDFADKRNIKSITLGINVDGKDLATAFSEYSGLQSVTVYNTVAVSSFSQIFAKCVNSITSVTIGKGVTAIGERSFFGCTGLTSIDISDTVESIGVYAFYGTALKSIDIPDSVKSIGNFAFFYVMSLKSVNFGKGVKSFGESAFHTTGLAFITLPNDVKSIGTKAFYNCTSLTSVTILDSLDLTIGQSVFQLCKDLASVTFAGTNPPHYNYGAKIFSGCKVSSVNVPCDYQGTSFCGDPILKDCPTSTELFSLSESFSHSELFSPSQLFSASERLSSSNSFSLSEFFKASESFRASESFSASDLWSASNSFSGSESLSASESFSTSKSFSNSEFAILPDQTQVITPKTDDTSPQEGNERSSIAVIAGAVAAIAVVAIVVATVLVCYVKRLACFQPKADDSDSGFEATADVWSIDQNTATLPTHEGVSSFNSEIADDPFIHVME